MNTINLKVSKKVYDESGVVLTLEYSGTDGVVSGSLLVQEPIDTTVHIGDAYTVGVYVEEVAET